MSSKDGRGSERVDDAGTIPRELMEHAKSRTAQVVKRLRDAMGVIEKDIDEHEGLYPFNGGTLNQAEVCRRAGIKKGTLQGKNHKTTTKSMVDAFVERVNAGVVSGRKSVRRVVTSRADHWKQAHAKIAQAYHTDHLKLESAEARIVELEDELRLLREQLALSSGRKVLPMVKKGK
ncbi:hypothetical protein R77569_00463 [Ralstonia mannitolilytica]|uniref:DNA-binding protein n=1 Tax=Ralstonia mannitolilytica TaxID=105219 RepID=A0ABM9KDZ0_9RALS|nr:hypothetical protein [Ralstonia mannitolilytica]CAJ0851267.1 hypothetical protein R77569_00463 [Ralstonia mannitolilytica]